MNKALMVALREFVDNLRTKTFWIGIFSIPVILVLAIVIPIWLEKAKDVRTYAVIDESGWLLPAVDEMAATRDLARVFGEVADRHRKGGRDFEKLPVILRSAAPVLARLNPEQRALAAGLVAAPRPDREMNSDASGALPDAAREWLRRDGGPLRVWWWNLPARDAGKISKSLDRASYARLDLAATPAGARSRLNKLIADDKLFAYFVIGHDPVGGSAGCLYVSNNLTDESLKDWFGGLASEIVRTRRISQKGLDEAAARWIQEPVLFMGKKVSEAGAEAEVKTQDTVRQWAPVVFVYLLWISVFSIAQMLLNNTVEEKSNRLIEVLLSSVSPLQLMAGKIAGIAATGLTMILSWVIFFIGAVLALPLLLGGMPPLGLGRIASDPVFLGSFVVYFLLGYLLYAAVLVGIGSVCNSLKEAQNLLTPVMLLLIVPLMAMTNIARDPNGMLARVMSYIPLFTPFVMMNRAAGPPSFLEYLLTSVLMVVAVAGALWAAAKIFRIGILMTGKPPRPMEILRWLRQPGTPTPESRA